MESLPKLIKLSDQVNRFKEMDKASLLELLGSMIKLDQAQQIELVALGKSHGAVNVPALGADWSLIGWRMNSYVDDNVDHVVYALNIKTKQIKFINTQLQQHFGFSLEQAVDYAEQHFGQGGKHLFEVLKVISPESFTIEIGDQSRPTVFTENMRIWSIGGNGVAAIDGKYPVFKKDFVLYKLSNGVHCVAINTAKRTFNLLEINDKDCLNEYLES